MRDLPWNYSKNMAERYPVLTKNFIQKMARDIKKAKSSSKKATLISSLGNIATLEILPVISQYLVNNDPNTSPGHKCPSFNT